MFKGNAMKHRQHLAQFRLTFGSIALLVFAGICVLLVGCAGRPQIIPNSDPALRKTSAQFAADAAKRHPYKSDAPRGGQAQARAQVGYSLDVVEIANNSAEDWNDVEVWVNHDYVVYLPKMEHGKLKSIPFQMLFNGEGKSFPTDNSKVLVNTVEIYRDGKMWDVPKQQAD